MRVLSVVMKTLNGLLYTLRWEINYLVSFDMTLKFFQVLAGYSNQQPVSYLFHKIILMNSGHKTLLLPVIIYKQRC